MVGRKKQLLHISTILKVMQINGRLNHLQYPNNQLTICNLLKVCSMSLKEITEAKKKLQAKYLY